MPAAVTTYADGMISVSDHAGRSLPMPSQTGILPPTGSPNPVAANAATQSPIKSAQAAPPQTTPSRSTIPAGRGVQIRGVQSWPGAAAPTQFYAAAQAMPLQNMPLASVAPESENILQAAFQQRLDAVHTSAGTFLPPNQPTPQIRPPAVNAAQ